MKAIAIHYQYSGHENHIPEHETQRRKKEGEKPTACGYTRKSTTIKRHEVTCFFCRKFMQKTNLLP